MLYVFLVDVGVMYTFEMEMAMESVQTLMGAIATVAGVPVDKQVLLISGGEALDPNDRVCNYSSAGTDTSPIYLFSKTTIESSVPPSPSLNLGSEASLKEQAEISFKLPPTYETLVSRAQLASEFHHYAVEIAQSCESLINEQKCQQLGWGAVVANLESISREFNERASTVQQSYAEFLDARSRYIEMLVSFKDILPLLAKIPVLHCLLSSQHHQLNRPQLVEGISLLDWISAQDHKNSLQDMVSQCLTAVEQFDQSVLEDVIAEINQVQEALTNASMKEIKGLEERLEGLQQLLQKVHELVQSQSDMAQGFLQNQTRAQNIGDPSVLPDLCASHQKQLMVLLKNHSQLRDFRRRCAKAKDELSINLHTRLRWIMYVEKKVCDCDSTLIIYHENIRRIKRRLDILEQVGEAPKLYVLAIAEVVHRRSFSSQYFKWAMKLHENASQVYAEELARREEFALHFGRHFLQNMFTGLDDRPHKFLEKPPKEFDNQLPIITENDLQQLQTSVPKLSEYLDSSPINVSMRDVSTVSTLFTSELKFPQESHSPKDTIVTSVDKTSAMSVDTSTQVEWTIGGEKGGEGKESCWATTGGVEEQEGQIRVSKEEGVDGVGHQESVDRGTDMSVMQESVDDRAPLVIMPSEGEEPSKEYSSHSDTGSDSDLMFRSAQEDYVTVVEADLQPGEECRVSVDQGDADELLQPGHDTSQTLTLTSSGSQSTETSTQTDLIFDEKLSSSAAPEEPSPEPTTGSSDGAYEDKETHQNAEERVLELEDMLGNCKNEIERLRTQNGQLNSQRTSVAEVLGSSLKAVREDLASSKEFVKGWRTQCSREIDVSLGNVHAVIERISQTTSTRQKQECEEIINNVTEKYEMEKKDLLDAKTRCEIEKNDADIEVQRLRAENENLEVRHREEVEKLSSSFGEVKAKYEEQQVMTMKLRDTKTRSEEDQQTRFNAIMMRLKRERDQVVGELNEKMRQREAESEERKHQLESMAREKDSLAKGREEEARGFKEKENELLTALSSTEGKLREIQNAVEERETEFQAQLEKEKASALLLLEVERQMWEAERTKQEAESMEDARLVPQDTQMYMERVQQLEVENKMLNERLASQTDVLSRAVLDFEEAEMNPIILQAKQALQDKDEQIRMLQQQLAQQQQEVSGATAAPRNDQVSLKDFQRGDLILLVFDPRYENYLVFSTGPTLFFLHPESMAVLDLATTGPKRRDWSLAVLSDKEYCQAKKAHNRFHVPVGTKFYRIHAQPCDR